MSIFRLHILIHIYVYVCVCIIKAVFNVHIIAFYTKNIINKNIIMLKKIYYILYLAWYKIFHVNIIVVEKVLVLLKY